MMMDRRSFLKKLGVSATAAAAIPLSLNAATEDTIVGEMDQWRAVQILAGGLKVEPTLEELRMMVRDVALLPESLDWVGIASLRIIVIDIIMEHECLDFRTDMLTCPEFRAMMPRYRNHLRDVHPEGKYKSVA